LKACALPRYARNAPAHRFNIERTAASPFAGSGA